MTQEELGKATGMNGNVGMLGRTAASQETGGNVTNGVAARLARGQPGRIEAT